MVEQDTKRCVNCNIDMTVDLEPSKYDQKYCIYCQNQEDGSFETSRYAKVYEFVSRKFFPRVHGMNEKDSKANAAALIRSNPSVILRHPCVS